MKRRDTIFVFIYSAFLLLDLACGFDALAKYRIVSKPLILISLIIYYCYSIRNKKHSSFLLMFAALFISLLGDIFLLFENISTLYFTFGLAAFLIAHVFFALVFGKRWNKETSKEFMIVVIALIGYGFLLFYILMESLGSLLTPVILYIIGILTMVITAYRRKGMVPTASFKLVVFGALFFVISDSVLAYSKFISDIPYSHIIVMSTYAIAQLLITKGVLSQDAYRD